ncbi:unannotated protein [freshwater metagenome]|uniref:Unannotated protein n=1 Tax=freshwater metagenome TaxID=449393 RepID=A0A6J7E793_9ZZZZ
MAEPPEHVIVTYPTEVNDVYGDTHTGATYPAAVAAESPGRKPDTTEVYDGTEPP